MRSRGQVRVFSLLMSMLFFLMSGCGKTEEGLSEPEHTIDIVYSKKLLKIAGQTPAEWVADLEAAGEGEYEDIYSNSDGTVTMVLLTSQIEFWLDLRKSLLDELDESIKEKNENFSISYSDDFAELDLYYTLDLDAYEAIYYVINAEVMCACCQLLNGSGPDGWKVTVSIYNSGTGKLVSSGTSETGLSYTEDDWEASET